MLALLSHAYIVDIDTLRKRKDLGLVLVILITPHPTRTSPVVLPQDDPDEGEPSLTIGKKPASVKTFLLRQSPGLGRSRTFARREDSLAQASLLVS